MATRGEPPDTEEVVDKRGHVVLFEGAVPIIAVTKAGGVRRIVRPPVWSRVKTVHYVCGVSLDRVAVITRFDGNARSFECIVNRVAPQQLQWGCDTCTKSHSSRNPSCSANLGVKTFASKPFHLYDITTRKDLGRWVPDILFLKASKTGMGTFTKV